MATAVSATKEGPKARTEKKADRAKNKDLLARNMKLLNQWGEQPASKTPDIVLAGIADLVEQFGLR